MTISTFASIIGLFYIGVGILGFIPGITSSPLTGAPPLTIETSYGYLLGLFPVNVILNFVHIGIGVWGFLASKNNSMPRTFAIGMTVIGAQLAIMGILTATNTFFGFMPLFGHNVWLHAITAVIAAYFGFFAPADNIIVRRTNTGTDKVKVYEERPRL